MKTAEKTPFGLHVWHYMEKCKPPILTETALADYLKDSDGKRLSQKTISLYLTGKRDVPFDFVDKCASLFELNEQQHFKLFALALFSSKKITIETKNIRIIPQAIIALIALILWNKNVKITDEETYDLREKATDGHTYINAITRLILNLQSSIKSVVDELQKSMQ